MIKDVMIEIDSRQKSEGAEPESIEMVVEGSLETDGDNFILKYTDNDVETVLSVENSESGQIVNLDRTGADVGRLTIQKNQRHMSFYQMGPFEFTIGIFGEKLDCRLDETNGTLDMRYTIDINSTFASRNEVSIKVSDMTH